MGDLNKLGLAEARDKLRSRDLTSVDLTQACLDAIEGAGALNAFVHNTPELALEQARAADARIAMGDAPDMCVLPLGIKDLFCTKGVPSKAGCSAPDASGFDSCSRSAMPCPESRRSPL